MKRRSNQEVTMQVFPCEFGHSIILYTVKQLDLSTCYSYDYIYSDVTTTPVDHSLNLSAAAVLG
jgi:hypothetical protein